MRLGLGIDITSAGIGHNGGPSYDAEARSYFTRAGITDADAKTAIDAFIVGVKADFTITLLDEVFDQLVLQANESAAASVVDMTANAMDQVLINSPTFTQWSGVANAGGTDYIDTNFNPVTNGVKFTNTNKLVAFYLQSFTGTGNIVFGLSDFVSIERIFYPNGDGSNRTYRDTSANIAAAHGGVFTGLYGYSRTANNAAQAWFNDTSQGTAANAAAAAVSQKFHTPGLSAPGDVHYGPSTNGNRLALTALGRGLTAGEWALFNARVQTLKTAIGW